MGGQEAVVHAWKEWGIQALVLLSLTLQIALLVLAEFRRRVRSGVLMIFTWSAYMMADATAMFVLGHMSVTSRSTPTPEHQLVAFWAPFLLLHLGGQDNITAYSIEDSRLWLRHMQALAVQVAATAYVIYESSIITGGHPLLRRAAILMFMVGAVKYGERVCALWCASRTGAGTHNYYTFAQPTASHVQSPAQHGVESYSVEDTEAYIVLAHRMLNVPKSLLKSSPPDGKSYNIHGARLYKVVEMQLSLMHDILYTKAEIIHKNWYGIFIRMISATATATAFVLFHRLVRNDDGTVGYNRDAVAVTYVLLVGAIVLETLSLLRAAFSSWTLPRLIDWDHKWNIPLACVVSFVRRLVHAADLRGRYWSAPMGQHNLLQLSTRSRASISSKMARGMGLEDLWNTQAYSWSIPVSRFIEKKLMNRVFKKCQQDFERYQLELEYQRCQLEFQRNKLMIKMRSKEDKESEGQESEEEEWQEAEEEQPQESEEEEWQEAEEEQSQESEQEEWQEAEEEEAYGTEEEEWHEVEEEKAQETKEKECHKEEVRFNKPDVEAQETKEQKWYKQEVRFNEHDLELREMEENKWHEADVRFNIKSDLEAQETAKEEEQETKGEEGLEMEAEEAQKMEENEVQKAEVMFCEHKLEAQEAAEEEIQEMTGEEVQETKAVEARKTKEEEVQRAEEEEAMFCECDLEEQETEEEQWQEAKEEEAQETKEDEWHEVDVRFNIKPDLEAKVIEEAEAQEMKGEEGLEMEAEEEQNTKEGETQEIEEEEVHEAEVMFCDHDLEVHEMAEEEAHEMKGGEGLEMKIEEAQKMEQEEAHVTKEEEVQKAEVMFCERDLEAQEMVEEEAREMKGDEGHETEIEEVQKMEEEEARGLEEEEVMLCERDLEDLELEEVEREELEWEEGGVNSFEVNEMRPVLEAQEVEAELVWGLERKTTDTILQIDSWDPFHSSVPTKLKRWGLYTGGLTRSVEERVLAWHIATNIYVTWWYQKHGKRPSKKGYGYNQQQRPKATKAEAYKMEHSKKPIAKVVEALSNYMVFLLAARPDMLSPTGSRNAYVEVCYALATQDPQCETAEELAEKLWRYGEDMLKRQEISDDVEDSDSGSNIIHQYSPPLIYQVGCKLGAMLIRKHTEGTLNVIAQVWVETLYHVALGCSAYAHAKQLSNIGEPITVAAILVEYLKRGIEGVELRRANRFESHKY